MDKTVAIGNPALLRELGIDSDAVFDRAENSGVTAKRSSSW